MGTDGPVPSLDYFTDRPPGRLEVFATWCPARTASDAAGSTDSRRNCRCSHGQCTRCLGDPVDVTNGNMHFVESDPIPGAAVVPFRRVYDSRFTRIGWFGPGTTTFLDAVLFVTAEGSDPAAIISLMDEESEGYVFRKFGGNYRQVTPPPGTQPTMIYHDANGEWRHVSSDGRLARVFHADGRLSTLPTRRVWQWCVLGCWTSIDTRHWRNIRTQIRVALLVRVSRARNVYYRTSAALAIARATVMEWMCPLPLTCGITWAWVVTIQRRSSGVVIGLTKTFVTGISSQDYRLTQAPSSRGGSKRLRNATVLAARRSEDSTNG